MPTLPTVADMVTSNPTNATQKVHVTNLLNYLAGLLGTAGTSAVALATLGALGGAYATLTSATTLAVTDRGEVINASGTWALTLPAAATAGAGWSVILRNSGAGTITFTPAGADLVDGASSVAVLAGRSALIVSTGAGWMTFDLSGRAALTTIDLPLGGTGVQSAVGDATAGRLMINGAHGLGIAGTPQTLTNLDQTDLPTGHYRTTSATTLSGTWPPGRSAENAVVSVERLSAAVSIQRYYPTAGGGTWERRYSGSWGAWERSTPVLGTVTQTGGVPTGPLIEAGSNANGIYRRFACGLQECWRTDLSAANANTALGSVFRSASVTWTFPAAFASGIAPVVTGDVDDVDVWLSTAAPTNTSVAVRALAAVTKGSALTLRARAVGRWFT